MSVSFVALPAGTMTAASVLANFALLRTWMNGGAITADIVDANVRAQHIFRPDSFGYPASAQHRASACETTAVCKAWDSIDQRAAVARIDLLPHAAYYNEAVRCLPDLGRSFTHWGPDSYAIVNVTWSAIAVPVPGSAPPEDPYQGYFQLRHRSRTSSDAGTIILVSRRYVQTKGNPSACGIHYSTQARFSVSAGEHDVWLEWNPDIDVQTVLCAAVIVGLNSFSVRTYRQA